MKVVIVESPNKCETIKKYLGDDYKVIASKGHVRDLATSGKAGLGVDCENGFKPTYTVIKSKRTVVNEIKAAIKGAEEVILATDPDREGEAIAWHLSELLRLKEDNKRLEFHEITRDAITEAIRHPRTIDKNLVASQEARRIIDRIIGFRLSDVLQRKNNLRSGGRVQSATLKLIVDHEREIAKFKPEEYWTITARLKKDNVEIEAPLYKYKDSEDKITNKAMADEIVNATGQELKIVEINKSVKTINPKLPYTTSSLQQDAISRLGMSAARVSRVAQELYEGIKINGQHEALITYIRTDSTYLSETYVNKARAYIKERFGEEYVGPYKNASTKGKEFTQNAHEAIRPTSNHRTPSIVRPYLNNNQYRLYELIYNRALAFLMTSKKEESTSVVFANNDVKYKVTGNKTIYKGYEVLTGGSENKSLGFEPIEGDVFTVSKTDPKQNFTTPPPHYSEAKIIKLMEEKGIGRPSTYSSTISTLQNRTYVIKDKGAVIPTSNGTKAIEFLENKFKDIVDTTFTAKMEKDLDEVQDGETSRTATINQIYIPFMKEYDEAIKETLGNCPKCGAPLKRVKGRYGSFTGCSRYPDCDYKKKEEKNKPEYLDKKCPQCGRPLVKRTNKKGKSFVACSGFPECKYIEGKSMTPKKLEIIKKCPACKDGNLVVRKGWNKQKKQVGFFLGCTNFPKCRHTEDYNPSANINQDD
ncbi:MAG: type I DNA topoisomerase [Bacilli bacterium]|nr:type I DNA topoisomerase [Bacilli bacterium]